MKKPAKLVILTFLLLSSACATTKGPATDREKVDRNSDLVVSQNSAPASEQYVRVIDELIANGCNISTFEIVNRKKVLDMKVSCK